MNNKPELKAESLGVSEINPFIASVQTPCCCLFVDKATKSSNLLQIQEPVTKTDTEVTSKKE